MKQAWLKCFVRKGMFSDERAISCKTMRGVDSVFVPTAFVQGQINQEGRVRVGVIDCGDFFRAILPTTDSKEIPVSFLSLGAF